MLWGRCVVYDTIRILTTFATSVCCNIWATIKIHTSECACNRCVEVMLFGEKGGSHETNSWFQYGELYCKTQGRKPMFVWRDGEESVICLTGVNMQ